jgi:hypothetical protein
VTAFFLKAVRTETNYDASSFELKIDSGSSLSFMKISPMYKNRTEVGKIFAENEVKLQSDTVTDHLIHRTLLPQPLISSYGGLYDKANINISVDQLPI